MSGRPRTDKPTGLRAALAAKKVRVEHYPIPLVDQDVVDPLAKTLQVARQAAFRASLGDDKAEQTRAAAAVTKAQAAFDKCFWRVGFRGLTDDADFDALVNAHPATPEQIAAATGEPPEMDLDSFHLALLVACIVDGDGMTVDDWRTELWTDRWTRADRQLLFATVRAANDRDFSAGIPNA